MRTLDQISREEWLVYQWHEVTPQGSCSRVFVKGKARQRDTINHAAQQYDEMIASLTQRSTNQTKEETAQCRLNNT